MKRISKMLLLVFFLVMIYVYILVINYMPSKIILFEGEELNLKTILGIKIKNTENNTIQTSSGTGEEQKLEVSLFDKISVKNVDLSIIPKSKVILLGNIAGVKLYTSGVLVVGMSQIQGIDSKNYKPYENSGIEEGDTIIKIDNTQINSTDDLVKMVNESKGEEIKIDYIHDEETKQCSITPIETTNSEYKLGLWVRDSAAGVGTVTFYDETTKTFGALGHGITDVDTNELINIASGEFITTRILNIKKGESGTPRKNTRYNRKPKQYWNNK